MAQGAEQWRPVADRYARKYGVPTELVMSVIQAESGGNARARSGAGAQGVMQLMPATARGLGVRDPFNAEQNIAGGTKMLGQLLHQYKGDATKAVAAYNAGAGAVNKYGGVPPYAETQAYVKRVLGGAGLGGRVDVPSSAPVSAGAVPAASGPFSALQQAALNRIFADDPTILGAIGAMNTPAAATTLATPVATPTAPIDAGTGATWKQLQRLGQQVAGLKNDPGDEQTTGGHHAAGSYHYQGRAIDFGDARNSPQQLREFAAWARQNPGQIKELYYNPLGWGIRDGKIIKGLTVAGHDNHLHIAM